MNLTGIAKYLEDKKIGRRGKTIFVNEMPLDCEIGIVLRDRYSGTPFDHNLPGYFNTGFRAAVERRTGGALVLTSPYLVAERVRSAVAERGFELGAGRPLGVTVSVGVALNESDADTPEMLLKRADVALYRAKREGRNRVVFDAA